MLTRHRRPMTSLRISSITLSRSLQQPHTQISTLNCYCSYNNYYYFYYCYYHHNYNFQFSCCSKFEGLSEAESALCTCFFVLSHHRWFLVLVVNIQQNGTSTRNLCNTMLNSCKHCSCWCSDFYKNKCKKLNSLQHLVRTTVAGSHN